MFVLVLSKLQHFPGQPLDVEYQYISLGDAWLGFKAISVLAQTKFTGSKTESIPMRNNFYCQILTKLQKCWGMINQTEKAEASLEILKQSVSYNSVTPGQ